MAYFNGRSYTSRRGLNLTSANGVIRFETPDETPVTTSGERLLYVDASNQLTFDSGSSTSVLGTAGAVANFNLNDAYDDGRTITVDAGPVILAGANQDTATLNVTADGPSAGPVILIANSGSGNDVTGTAGWTITKAGLATFATNSIVSGVLKLGTGAADGELTSNGAYNLVISTNSGSSSSEIEIVQGTNGDVDITLNGTGAVNVNGTTTHNDALVIAAGDLAVTLGHFTLIDDQNANSFTVTNNTHTTNSATTGGIVELQSTSLTTGTLLNLELDESNLDGGEYIRCYDSNTTEDVFTVKENGAVTITGVAASNMLTITLGDVSVAGGSVTIIDSDNATSLSVVNNTFTTGNALVDISSTSITNGALVRLNANTIAHDGEVLEVINAGDAASTGVGVSITMPAIVTGAARGIDVTMALLTTTGFGIRVTMDAITTGDMLYLDNGGDTLTAGSGFFINCNDDNVSKFSVSKYGATVIAGNASGTDALTLTAGDITVTAGDVTMTLGDLILTDSDASLITSVNGTGTVLTVANSGGAIGADGAVLNITANGSASNADSSVLRIVQDNSGGVSFGMTIVQDDLDVGFMNFEGTATADANSPISTHGTPGGTTDFIRIAINGVKAWIAVSTNDPSA